MSQVAIEATQKTLDANSKLQEQLTNYIQDLESEQEQLDKLLNNLSKLESALPEGPSDREVAEVETTVYGTHFEGLRHTLTAKQLVGETSPFRKAVEQRQWYEQMTTTRPFTRDETRLLHTSVILENKRLYALRARESGENPFTAVQRFPDSHFDVNDPEINWNSVAQNMGSIQPRSADQCRIIRLRVDWVEIARELGTNRTTLQCLRKFVFEPSPVDTASKAKEKQGAGTSKSRDKATGNPWSEEEDRFLLEGIQRHGMGNWPEVALHLNSAMAGKPKHVARTPNQCSFRYSKSLCPTIKKGKWTKEEDEALRKGVAAFGRMWTKVQEYVQGRTDAQCRERWSNMLDPGLKTGPWDEEEDKILLDAASQKLPWSKISALLPGRTDSRCAKRYQMLIKLQESASPLTEAQTQAPKRERKRKGVQQSPQSPTEGDEAFVASGTIDGGPSDSPAIGSIVSGAPKPKRRPQPKPKGHNRVAKIGRETSGADKARADANMEESVLAKAQGHSTLDSRIIEPHNKDSQSIEIAGTDNPSENSPDEEPHTSVKQPRRSVRNSKPK
ncbi:hypothetical protein OPQ81_009866 [Rhizoctonia solani]|nr:hypothetical protein OPQ81_009866 [Rhizoctonia solani]